MSERVIVAPRGPLLSPRLSALLVANVCFGYAFSSFLLLPKFMDTVLGAGPEQVGWVTMVHGATIVAGLRSGGERGERGDFGVGLVACRRCSSTRFATRRRSTSSESSAAR